MATFLLEHTRTDLSARAECTAGVGSSHCAPFSTRPGKDESAIAAAVAADAASTSAPTHCFELRL